MLLPVGPLLQRQQLETINTALTLTENSTYNGKQDRIR